MYEEMLSASKNFNLLLLINNKNKGEEEKIRKRQSGIEV